MDGTQTPVRARPSPHGRGALGAGNARPFLVLETAWYAVVWWAAVVVHVGTPRPRWDAEYWVMSVLALGCAGAAVARWRFPRATAAIAAAVIGLGLLVVAVRPLGSLGPLRLVLSAAVTPVLLAACVRRAPPVVTALVVALAAAAGGLDVVVGGNSAATDLASLSIGSLPSTALSSVTATVLVLAPVVAGLLLRHGDTIRQIAALDHLRTEERLRVARELHDTIANHVSGVVLAAQAAALTDELSEPSRRALGSIETAGQHALAAMARMVGALRSAEPDRAVPVGAELPPGTGSILSAVRLAIDGDPTVALRVVTPPADDGDRPELDPNAALEDAAPADVITTVHRILAEALTNARRYRAPDSLIEVVLAAPRGSLLTLDVSNRRSRPVRTRPVRTAGSGYGLIGLRERAAAVGGIVHAGPDGDHWRLHAELPR